jgi:two-component system nitrate/nitrite sensor histidine kinase NarX
MQFQRINLTGRGMRRRMQRRVGWLDETDDGVSGEAANSELQSLAEGFLSTICRISGAKAGVVRLFSSNGAELQLAGAVGLPPEFRECERRIDLACGACGQTAHDRDLHAADVTECARRFGTTFFGADCKGVVAVPLEYRGGSIGILTLFFPVEYEVSEPVSQLFRSFGELLGVALENARLSRENRRMSLLAERQAMANEVHDSLAQSLVFARMRMSSLGDAVARQDVELAGRCVSDINEALGEGQKAVRDLITHFRSPMDPAGLSHALEELVETFPLRTGIGMEYVNDLLELELPLEHELQVFHIVREILSNVARHSGARHVTFLVQHGPAGYLFTIQDDGRGLAEEAPPEGHYGLTIMRERARKLKGDIQLSSAPGIGTRVQLQFPDPAESLPERQNQSMRSRSPDRN